MDDVVARVISIGLAQTEEGPRIAISVFEPEKGATSMLVPLPTAKFISEALEAAIGAVGDMTGEG